MYSGFGFIALLVWTLYATTRFRTCTAQNLCDRPTWLVAPVMAFSVRTVCRLCGYVLLVVVIVIVDCVTRDGGVDLLQLTLADRLRGLRQFHGRRLRPEVKTREQWICSCVSCCESG